MVCELHHNKTLLKEKIENIDGRKAHLFHKKLGSSNGAVGIETLLLGTVSNTSNFEWMPSRRLWEDMAVVCSTIVCAHSCIQSCVSTSTHTESHAQIMGA